MYPYHCNNTSPLYGTIENLSRLWGIDEKSAALRAIGELESHNTYDSRIAQHSLFPVTIGLPQRKIHEGSIEDKLHLLLKCSFWADMKSNNPFVHILTKATPQRCQIRNLDTILYNYSQDDNFFKFLKSILEVSLFGLYRHSGVVIDVQQRLIIWQQFYTYSKPMLRSWIRNGHQCLLFFVLKEYLVFSTKFVPSLRNELTEQYKWNVFEGSVVSAMNQVRNNIKADGLVFSGLEHMLNTLNKQHVRHMFRPLKFGLLKSIIVECNRYAENLYKHFEMENSHVFYSLLLRCKDSTIPFQWLHGFGVSVKKVNALIDISQSTRTSPVRNAIRNLLETFTWEEIKLLNDLASMFARKSEVRLFTLPMQITINQIKALRKLHNVPDGQTSPPEMGKAAVCFECQTFKGFLCMATKPHSLRAYGYSKVLVDDDTMKLYCGKKREKVDNKVRNTTGEQWLDADERREANLTRNKRRNLKNKKKIFKNNRCSATEVTEVNLIGQSLQWYGTTIMICQYW
jgi:hypothetical protein